MHSEGNPTRTVDSVLFRTGGTAYPANSGKGFLIDNMKLTSGPVPAVTPNPTYNPGGPVGGIAEVRTGQDRAASSAGQDGGSTLPLTFASSWRSPPS